jgi:hypothetical protein
MKRQFILIPVMALMAACQREVPQGPDREVEIRITTGTTLAGAQTRAPGSTTEDAIKNVAVLIFDNSLTPEEHDDATFKRGSYAWAKNAASGLWSAIIEIGDKMDIYFAINAKGAVDAALADAVAGTTTFGDIKDKLTLTAVDVTGVGLPMWGYRHNASISSGARNSFGTVKVLRAVAAAEIAVSAPGFEFLHGSVEYASTKGLLPYSRGNIQFDATELSPDAPQKDYKLIAPEVPTGTATTRSVTATSISNDGKIVDQLFFFENDKDDTKPEKEYTKVVVGGKYDPTPADLTDNAGLQVTYYPLAFRLRTETELVNERAPIVRNTKFVFSVSRVNGPGLPSVEDAKDAEDQNIDYEVIQWDEWNQGDIVTWGSYWLSVGKSRNENAKGTAGEMKNAYLYRNKGSDDEIAFSTNITDFGKYKLGIGTLNGSNVYVDDAKDEAYVFTNDAKMAAALRTGESVAWQIANDYYEVYFIKGKSTGSNANEGRIVVYAMQDYAERNASRLMVISGEIKYAIRVTQGNSAPEDWVDGGDQPWFGGR